MLLSLLLLLHLHQRSSEERRKPNHVGPHPRFPSGRNDKYCPKTHRIVRPMPVSYWLGLACLLPDLVRATAVRRVNKLTPKTDPSLHFHSLLCKDRKAAGAADGFSRDRGNDLLHADLGPGFCLFVSERGTYLCPYHPPQHQNDRTRRWDTNSHALKSTHHPETHLLVDAAQSSCSIRRYAHDVVLCTNAYVREVR
jgi:hypothetical protein